ncbi:MAG: hypothetical protein SVK54_02025 [candidate division WOR-3 bacterium]|nr:hypothetical protein [candidate division WOR-3 bacterium]
MKNIVSTINNVKEQILFSMLSVIILALPVILLRISIGLINNMSI